METKKQTGKPPKKGTTICFKPDKTIFSGGIEFEYALLSSRLRELAYLNGGVKIVLSGLKQIVVPFLKGFVGCF